MNILNDLEIAIPTYKRPHCLRTKTLAMFPPEFKQYIKIYMNDEEDLELYKSVFGDEFNDYQWVNTRSNSIGYKRNYIKTTCNKKYLLQIDDDIAGLIGINESKVMCPQRVAGTIMRGFIYCERENLHLWGICPYHNSFYMKQHNSTNLKFICGGFHGTILTKVLTTPINAFEDYYNTLNYFKSDGGVLRLNDVGLKTKLFTNAGGLQSLLGVEGRKKEEEENADLIVNEFGEKMVRKVYKKRGVDLRLNYHYKT